MKKNILTTLSFLFLTFATLTVTAMPASDTSIKELMKMMHSDQVIEVTKAQIKLQMAQVVEQALKKRKPNKQEQQAIEKMNKNIFLAFDEEINREKLEAMSIRLYKASFSEEEISGIIRFHKTPAGQALINKLPLVTKNTMQEIQQMMGRYIPKIKKIGAEFDKEFLAASH